MATVCNDRKYIILNNDQNIKRKFKIFSKTNKKRSFREPIAYLTNKKYFWNMKFFVTKDTLNTKTRYRIDSRANIKINKTIK